ncbi:hypothetical protein [Janthinobacterium sp. B9-8]|uniref:hypothetical protein n=1 Tax=Janthinobacterium sp. B9-8 TaxID=1236179 RepID=UPI00061D0565|nr:hypothetical protein [Janthinobacterium sp. B9-8]AMC36611.1 hypothetical protein VN23_19455 [Janthinobacterium sp. B9-8]
MNTSSINKGGRPKGSTASVSAFNQLSKHVPELINQVLNAARNGDVHAATSLLTLARLNEAAVINPHKRDTNHA